MGGASQIYKANNVSNGWMDVFGVCMAKNLMHATCYSNLFVKKLFQQQSFFHVLRMFHPQPECCCSKSGVDVFSRA